MPLIFSDIKKRMNEKNLSVETVAVGIGMTKEGLYAALKNESLKIRDLEKIALILNMDIREFFEVEKMEYNNNIFQTNNNGDNNNLINTGTLNRPENLKVSENDYEKEITHLKELLIEKERLIQVLMNK